MADKKIFCTQCGKEVDAEFNNCPYCGAKLVKPDAAAVAEEPKVEVSQNGDQTEVKVDVSTDQSGTTTAQAGENQTVVVNVNAPGSSGMTGDKSKIAAGLLAIFIGTLGIHKFYLGYATAGVIMLLVTLLTCGVGALVMCIISIVEVVIYLTKSDQDFYITYELGHKEWF